MHEHPLVSAHRFVDLARKEVGYVLRRLTFYISIGDTFLVGLDRDRYERWSLNTGERKCKSGQSFNLRRGKALIYKC